MRPGSALICVCLLGWFHAKSFAYAHSAEVQEVAANTPRQNTIKTFRIPSLPANEALILFGRQANVTIVFSASRDMAVPQARAVNGSMTVQAAIRRLLAGTALQPEQVDSATYSVHVSQSARSFTRLARRNVTTAPGAAVPTDPAMIVVTGTRRTAATAINSVANVDVNLAETVRDWNVKGELTSTLAALSPSIDAPRSTLNGTPEAVRNIRFRGLNPDQLLILVNGQRRHTSAVVHVSSIFRGAAGVDINGIPQIAIDRIEILRDGAAAQYGADAVAGVVNFILKDQPKGGEFSVTLGSHLTHIPAIDQFAFDGQTLVLAADSGHRVGAHGALRLGGEITVRGATNRAGFDQIPSFIDLPADSPLRGARNYRLGDGQFGNANVYFTFNTGDDLQHLVFFGHATIGLRAVSSAYSFRYPGTSATDDTLYPTGFRPQSVGQNVDVAGTFGMRRSFEDWRLEVVAARGSNYFENRLENTLNASLGAASPTAFRIGSLSYRQTSLQATAIIDKSVHASLTMGAELRFEQHRTTAADPAAYEAGPLVDRQVGAQGGGVITAADASARSRTNLSAYVAAEFAPSEHLSLLVATRMDRASDYATALTGRIGANLTLGRFIVRASASRNYRAPNLGQLNYSVTNSDFSADLRLQQQLNPGGDNRLLPAFGFGRLRPETSVNWTLGTGYRRGGFQLTADAYLINIADRIAVTPLISNEAAVAVASEITGNRVESVRFPVNRYDTHTKGIDLAMSWSGALGQGDLSLRSSLSLVETRETAIAPVPRQLQNLAFGLDWTRSNPGFRDVPASYLDVQAAYHIGRLHFLWRTARFGGSEESRRGPPATVQILSSDWRHDLSIAWRRAHGLELRLGVENLFDAYPDQTVGAERFFGNFPYSYVRPIGLNGRYIYASMRRFW